MWYTDLLVKHSSISLSTFTLTNRILHTHSSYFLEEVPVVPQSHFSSSLGCSAYPLFTVLFLVNFHNCLEAVEMVKKAEPKDFTIGQMGSGAVIEEKKQRQLQGFVLNSWKDGIAINLDEKRTGLEKEISVVLSWACGVRDVFETSKWRYQIGS